MDKRQEPPQQRKDLQGPQNQAGWQYEQKQSGTPPQRRPPLQSTPSNNVPLGPNQYPPNQQNVPARNPDPILDMNATLGYGQGLEYQYFQPSQPLPRLRRDKREERLHELQRLREVQHPRREVPIEPRRRRGNANTPFNPIQSPPRSSPSDMVISPPGSMAKPTHHAAPVAQPAAQPAEDTAMIKKVRIGRASAILMMAFVASRVLGLVRTSMFAATFGTGATSDAFVQASLLPDTIFNIIAAGALSSAFIPTFTKYMVGENDERMAWQIANTALTLAVTGMVLLAIIGAIFADPLVWLYSPS